MSSQATMPALETVDPEQLRACMAHWASGVTVVTTLDDEGRPQGFTASAFCSASLRPPLVLVCLDLSAHCLTAFQKAGSFAVHVLREDQEELAMRFARKSPEKFAGLGAVEGVDGVPLLPDALALIECRAVDRVPVGDHVALIGEVVRCGAGRGEPLLYHRRGFRQLR